MKCPNCDCQINVASELGKRAKGKAKSFSQEERQKRGDRLRAYHAAKKAAKSLHI